MVKSVFFVIFCDIEDETALAEFRELTIELEGLSGINFKAFVPIIYDTRAQRYIFHRAKGLRPHDSAVRYFKKIISG